MRLWVGGLLTVVASAALALPSTASHEAIDLRVLDPKVELAALDGSAEVPVRFEYSPPHPDGQASVLICWNGQLDRAGLSSKHENDLCSAGFPGTLGTSGDATSAIARVGAIGRFEAVQRRQTLCELECDPTLPPHWNASNVVSFEVVDRCRLTLGAFRFLTRTTPVMRGAPFPCDTAVKGSMALSGEDGSALGMASSGFLTVGYRTDELRVPTFRVIAGGATADLSARLESRLAGSMVARAATDAVTVFFPAPASVSLVHRNGTTTVRARQGRVVVLNVGSQASTGFRSLFAAVRQRCGSGRPTVACLSRMRYRFSTTRRLLRPRVLRAGQQARFKNPPSAVRFR